MFHQVVVSTETVAESQVGGSFSVNKSPNETN